MGRGLGSPSERRALVIGCGFLGGNVACGLARRGVEVRVLSRSFAPPAAAMLPARALVEGDVSSHLILERALAGVDEVIYCVGGLQPAGAELDPRRDASLMLGPLRELVAALRGRHGVALTYLSSGGAVYGNPRRLPVSEAEPPDPIGAYATVRLAGERIVVRAHEEHGIPVRVLRCANVYGEGQPVNRGQGAVGVFLDRILRGVPIELFGDGGVVRDYVYVGDVVEVIARLITDHGGSTLMNVGSGEGTSLNELIGLLESSTQQTAIIVRRPGRGFDVHRVILDVTRMRRLVSVEPLGLSEGIGRLLASRPDSRPVAAAL